MALLAGRYKIQAEIGKGGYGTTYLASDLHKPAHPSCVVKQLRHSDPVLLDLFQREAVVLEKLGKHDQIPDLMAYFSEENKFYLVQEYIEGNNLRQEIYQDKKHTENYVYELLKDILLVLEFVHRQRVIHRDLKPENLIRRKHDGKICLIDFGVVKQISTSEVDSTGQVRTTLLVGTEGYVPGEQLLGKPTLASDLYALGTIAIEALTGVAPRKLKTKPKTRELIWRDHSNIQADLADFIDCLVQPHLNQRLASAPVALEKFLKLGQTSNSSRRPTVVVAPAYRGNNTEFSIPPQRSPQATQSLRSTLRPSHPRKLLTKTFWIWIGIILTVVSGWLALSNMDIFTRSPGSNTNDIEPYATANYEELSCVFDYDGCRTRLYQKASEQFWRMHANAPRDFFWLEHGFLSLEEQRNLLSELTENEIQDQLLNSDYQTGYAVKISDQPPGSRKSTTVEEFESSELFKWLENNAADFGFQLSFPKGHPYYEPWRWRYVGDEHSKSVFGES